MSFNVKWLSNMHMKRHRFLFRVDKFNLTTFVCNFLPHVSYVCDLGAKIQPLKLKTKMPSAEENKLNMSTVTARM